LIVVKSTLWLWNGGGASWHFISVPPDQSGEIRAQSLASRGGFGSVKVAATINGIGWRTSVFPQKSGGYLLPVKASVRRDADIAAGDEVTVELDLL
jgi:Domain of unknown function (DUF1905)